MNVLYIISWFGRDLKLRAFRKSIHMKQLEWARVNNFKIIVLAQEYQPEDYVDGIEYIHSDVFLRPCAARNVLLEHFYNSDEDYAVFEDNDTVLKDDEWGTSNAFIRDMRNITQSHFDQIDFVSGINPAIQAYGPELQKDIYKTHHVFYRTIKFSGGFFILKNLRKHKNIRIFFDDVTFSDETGNIVPGEEGDFCINLLMHGLYCYQNYKAIFNDMATAKRSTWAVKLSERTNKQYFVDVINQKHKTELLTLLNTDDKTFRFVGYSTNDGETDIRFCNDYTTRILHLRTKQHTDIVFHKLPYPMTIENIFIWAYDNIDDTKLRTLIDNNRHKTYRRMSNPRTKFHWERVPHPQPTQLLIPTENKLNTFFELKVIDLQ